MITSLYDPAIERVFHVEPVDITTPSGVTHYPFQSPEDWRDHWIYFLLVDRFSNPTAQPVSNAPDYGDYQGGTFEGIRQQLPYLKKMGAGALWLSPVLMNPQWFTHYWGGYCIMDFMHVEPRFCKDRDVALKNPQIGDDEFRSLVDEIHANGMYVILDIVLNHAADLFNYEGVRDSAPYNADREYNVYWRDDNGDPHGDWPVIEQVKNLNHDEAVWPEELQRNAFFRRRGTWRPEDPIHGDFDRMKELVTEFREENTDVYPVRNALIRAYQYLIGRFDLDGYRIDTLKHIETDFARTFGNAVREYAMSISKKNFMMFGEVADGCDEAAISRYVGASGDLMGVDAALDFPMNYHIRSYVKGWEPATMIDDQLRLRKEVWEHVISTHGDASRYYVTFLDNHDNWERITAKGWEKQTEMALTILITMQGIPTVYYGTEVGLAGAGNKPEYVREALWGQSGAFDGKNKLFGLIQRLAKLRDTTACLRYGRQYLRPCSGDGLTFRISEFAGGILAYSRILNDTETLVVANSSTTETVSVHVVVDAHLNPAGIEWTNILSSDGIESQPRKTESHAGNRTISVTLPPMTAQVWGRTPTMAAVVDDAGTTKGKRRTR